MDGGDDDAEVFLGCVAGMKKVKFRGLRCRFGHVDAGLRRLGLLRLE